MKFLLICLLAFPAQAGTSYQKNALPIFRTRCSLCHDNWSDKDWRQYDIAKLKKDLILYRVWQIRDMPLNNATGITEAERVIIKNWVEEGAQP